MSRTASPEKRAEWRRRMERFGRSCLTVADFCRSESVSIATFYYWRQQLQRSPVSQSVTPAKRPSPARHRSATELFVPVRLIDAFEDGVLARDEFDPRLRRARQRVEQCKRQLDELESESREQAELREALACLDDFVSSVDANLESADWTLRREILRTLIDHVEIEKEQIRIVYRINFPLFAKTASTAGNGKVLHFCWRGGLTTPGQHPPG